MSKGEVYPCIKCGKERTKEEGGAVFTVCDECWKVGHSPAPPTADRSQEETAAALAHHKKENPHTANDEYFYDPDKNSSMRSFLAGIKWKEAQQNPSLSDEAASDKYSLRYYRKGLAEHNMLRDGFLAGSAHARAETRGEIKGLMEVLDKYEIAMAEDGKEFAALKTAHAEEIAGQKEQTRSFVEKRNECQQMRKLDELAITTLTAEKNALAQRLEKSNRAHKEIAYSWYTSVEDCKRFQDISKQALLESEKPCLP